jgi:GNAT superfamily N-acetyltransferase
MTTIRIARDEDAQALPAVENAAGEAFRQIPDLAWIADGPDLPVARHRALIAGGASFVAVDVADRPVAYLVTEMVDDTFHLWEFAVRHDLQRQGIGRAMVRRAVAFARARGLRALTLTTFRDVPWNEPFYHSAGFRTLGAEEIDERLAAILRQEVRDGLPAERRCAMRLLLEDVPHD